MCRPGIFTHEPEKTQEVCESLEAVGKILSVFTCISYPFFPWGVGLSLV